MPNTIADNLQRLKAVRTAIGNAIVAKGGTVNSGDGFEDFPNDINTIPSSPTQDPKPFSFMIMMEPLLHHIQKKSLLHYPHYQQIHLIQD